MTWWNRRNTKAITTLVKQIAALTAMLMVLSCAGCATSSPNDNEQSQSSDSSQTHEQVKKSAEQSIDGAHLRDNESLYKVYDDSGVETMYLTVSRGNSSEGTDHSWSEINQYSVDDYAAMGVGRYKVNGLLQVGDEQGPVSGKLGFGESAPNATVQIRGQSSSKNEQKNYKIELKSGKGKWRGQRTIALNKHMGENPHILLKILSKERLRREIQLVCNLLDTQIRSFKQLFCLGNHHLHNPLQSTISRLLFNDGGKITWSNMLHPRIISNITLLSIQTEAGG